MSDHSTDAVSRTPDERFADLPDFPWEPHYVDVSCEGLDLRLARIDEGPADAPTIVLLHGEPTWSFLWRKVVPPLLSAGLRVVVPDLAGFGRSDKPTSPDWYSYDTMLACLDAHLAAIDLPERIHLVVHDWGGLLGLVWAMEHDQRIDRLVITDTALFAPGGSVPPAFQAWVDFVAKQTELPVAMIVGGATATGIDAAETAAYEAPFHETAAHAGALTLPSRVPVTEDMPGAERSWQANQHLCGAFDRPTLILWGGDDPVIPPGAGRRWADTIPGCVGMEVFSPASHFLQEDVGEQLGMRVAAFVTDTSL